MRCLPIPRMWIGRHLKRKIENIMSGRFREKDISLAWQNLKLVVALFASIQKCHHPTIPQASVPI